jgi:hypothetical protein
MQVHADKDQGKFVGQKLLLDHGSPPFQRTDEALEASETKMFSLTALLKTIGTVSSIC